MLLAVATIFVVPALAKAQEGEFAPHEGPWLVCCWEGKCSLPYDSGRRVRVGCAKARLAYPIFLPQVAVE